MSHLPNTLISLYVLDHLVLLRDDTVTLLREERIFGGSEPMVHPWG